MTYNEFCFRIAKKLSLADSQVRLIADAIVEELTIVAGQGEQVKLFKLGTFYPASYKARAGKLEFGTVGFGGTRRRLRFRPIDSLNFRLTEAWMSANQNTPAVSVLGEDESEPLDATSGLWWVLFDIELNHLSGPFQDEASARSFAEEAKCPTFVFQHAKLDEQYLQSSYEKDGLTRFVLTRDGRLDPYSGAALETQL